MAEDSNNTKTTGIWITAIVAICAALFFARDVLSPIAFAFLFAALLRPPVRWLEMLRVPTWVAASIVVLAAMGLIFVAGFLLSTPVQRFISQAPKSLDLAEKKLNSLRQPVARMTEVANRLEQVAQGPTTSPTTGPTTAQAAQSSSAPPPTQSSAAAAPPSPVPGVLARVFGGTAHIITGFTEVLLLLLLLLASGDLFYQKLLKILPFREDKRIAVGAVNEVQGVVMRYMLLNAIINFGQAIIVTLVLWWLGMPSPVLWGVFCFVLEFIPYLGAAIMIVMLSLVAVATFDGVGRILAAPGSYLLITTIQNNLISPVAYGNKLKLNPVAVLVAVMIWWFLWGIPGAFLAVPIVATMKIIADRTQGLNALGEFLGE